MQQNFSAHFPDFIRSSFPQLTGAIFGIIKGFNQRGFYMFVFLFGGESFCPHIFQDSTNGQTFYSLCAPVGGNFTGMASPELFRIAFKEHGIQFFAKAVDIEIFQ